MKTMILALFIGLSAFVSAQNCQVGNSCNGTVSASDGGNCTTANACVSLPLAQNTGAVGLSLGGTFTATIQFEASADNGATWNGISGTPLGSTTTQLAATGVGAWRFAVSGLTNIRVRGSAYTSGSATVTFQTSPTAASLGGGGAGITTFDQLGAGTNVGNAFGIGAGGSLAPTGGGTITANVGAFTGATQYFFPVFGASGSIGNSLCSTDAGITVLTCTYSGGLSIAGSGSGKVTLSGSTSGSAAFQVAAVAGSPNPMQLPTATSSGAKCLQSDGGNPQILSWVSCGSGSGTVNSGTAGQMAYYASSTPAVSGNSNANISNGALTLGTASATQGQVILEGGTSGALTVTTQGTAGTPTWTAGTSSGTPAVTASSPLGITTATGNVTCATCATTTNGGALSGTAPVAVSAAGAISVTGAAGQVLAGSGPAFTATPTLGVAGSTVGSVAFQNATSGTITVQPVTGALGSVTQSLPAAAGTFAVSATSPITESAAGAVGCATCATTSGGGSLTLDQVGAAAASWSPANGDQPLTLNFASTTSGRVSFKIGETSASTSAGTPYLAQIVAASGSTAAPLDIQQSETGSQAVPMLKLEPTLNTSGSPDMFTILETDTSSGASTNFIHLKGGASAATDEFIVSKSGTISANGSYGATATSSIVTLRGAGAHIESTATAAPTVTANCGTSPAIQTGGTDNAFRLNVGTGGSATACTVTFQKAFTNIPACNVTPESGTVFNHTAAPTTTTVVITAASAWAASTVLDVNCHI